MADVATCSYIASMHAVGIRELKNKLSHYVRLVEAGESVLVTHRGAVVAELRPPYGKDEGRSTVVTRLEELARRGGAVIGAPHDPTLYEPRPTSMAEASSEELLDAERGIR